MNITELKKHDIVIISDGTVIERAKIKSINEDGTVLIEPLYGKTRTVTADKIVKKIC